MNTDTDTRTEVDMPVADVGAATPGWLREATKLATDHRLDEIGVALESLAAGRGRQALRLAVIGEPSKGKSTLVNRLLGRNLLPTGSTAAMRATVVVGAGQDDALSVAWPDGRTEHRAVNDADAWRGLSYDATAGLTVRDDWLADLRVELADVPGVGAVDPDEFYRLRRTIAACDGALFVVSAVAPLSATELCILEEEAFGRHLPFVAVVVMMLDLVDAAERGETMRHIESRLATVPSHATVIIGPGQTGGEAELERLRAVLEHQALSTDRVVWRNRRVAAQVADHCVAMAGRAAEEMVAQRLAHGERETEVTRAMDLLETEAQDWDTLRLKLTSRQLTLNSRLRECVQQDRLGLIEKLRWDLERAPDPRGWWERNLASHLRGELSVLAKRVERLILTGLAADIAWLDDEVLRRLLTAEPSRPPASLDLEIVPEASGEVSDLSRTRLATRLGAQGGAIIGYLVAGGRAATPIFGVAFSLIGGLLAEASLRSATERQRREVDLLLIRADDESMSTFAEQASTVLAAVYEQIFARFSTNHLSWHQARLAAIDPGTEADHAEWSSLARASTALAATIHSALQG